MKNFFRFLMVAILLTGSVLISRAQQIENRPVFLVGTNAQRTAYQTSALPVGAQWFTSDTTTNYQWSGFAWITGSAIALTPVNTNTPTSTSTPFIAYSNIALANQKTPTLLACTPCSTTSIWTGSMIGIVPTATPAAVSFQPVAGGVSITGGGTGAATILAIEAP